MKEIIIDNVLYNLVPVEASKKVEYNRFDDIAFPPMDYHIADKDMTWQDAVKYAESLGEGWRLPTLHELQAYSPQLAAMNQGVWSGSTASDITNSAWVVSPANGGTGNGSKNYTFSVVCVRP